MAQKARALIGMSGYQRFDDLFGRRLKLNQDGRVNEFASAIEAVLAASESVLAASSIEPVSLTPEHVRSSLDAGEYGVAYEDLCSNLFEDDVAVSKTLLLRLQDAARAAGADPDEVVPLLT